MVDSVNTNSVNYQTEDLTSGLSTDSPLILGERGNQPAAGDHQHYMTLYKRYMTAAPFTVTFSTTVLQSVQLLAGGSPGGVLDYIDINASKAQLPLDVSGWFNINAYTTGWAWAGIYALCISAPTGINVTDVTTQIGGIRDLGGALTGFSFQYFGGRLILPKAGVYRFNIQIAPYQTGGDLSFRNGIIPAVAGYLGRNEDACVAGSRWCITDWSKRLGTE